MCRGQLVRRYKRFLADVIYQGASPEQGTSPEAPLTIHCPNTGKMTGCAEPGWTVYFSTSDNPKRKYVHTWELVENRRGDFICVNTGRANQLVAEALARKRIPPLAQYADIRAEVRYGNEGSRIDFLLSGGLEPDCYVEVKSVTLLDEGEAGRGYFPDTESLRAQKHVRELIDCVNNGHRAVLLFCVLHTGIERVSPASHLDPAYGALVAEALAAGVECLAWRAEISPDGMQLVQPLPFEVHMKHGV
nr:DNA/RNA nuclease SfsA [Oceanisphaera litoralis]